MIDISKYTEEQLYKLFSCYMDACIKHPNNPILKQTLNLIIQAILKKED